MQGFTRTSISILNLVLTIVPLASLTMGTLSFTGDKGSMELLFSQPVGREEILLGKSLGLFASLAISTLLGFLLSGIAVVLSSGTEGLLRYSVLVLLSLALTLVFLSLALLVAILNKRKSRAFGVSLLLWFFSVLFYDVIALGCSLLLKGSAANTFLFLSLFGNPVDMVRVATLISLDNVSVFGASGAALLRFFGGGPLALVALGLGLLFWTVIPWSVAVVLGRRQDL